ncbi:hypothetical protein BGX38DRAFT_1146017 [Terfezia claveryi]|nr:hypothetical protein BGX38DRAFT_1146017 [Terfezia claveryi]
MSSESHEESNLGDSSSHSLTNDGDEQLVEAPRLASEHQSESAALPSTGLSFAESDSTRTTIDSNSTYYLPRQCNEYLYPPSISTSGDTTTSRDSSSLATPRESHADLSLIIAANLERRPDARFRIEDYSFKSDAEFNVSERHRRDGGILPSPGTNSHLPCPFKGVDGCEVMFDVREKRLWKFHSLDHFQGVKPPERLVCTFGDPTSLCDRQFVTEGDKRLHNWNQKMEHFVKHYEEVLNPLRMVFDDDADPILDANALSEVIERHDENFELYIRRERRRLEGIIPPNRLHRSHGGARVREVVYGRPRPFPEPHLDSTNATQYIIAGGRRSNRDERIIVR